MFDFESINKYGFGVVAGGVFLKIIYKFLVQKINTKKPKKSKSELKKHAFFRNLEKWKFQATHLPIQSPAKKKIFADLLIFLLENYKKQMTSCLAGKVSLSNCVYLGYSEAEKQMKAHYPTDISEFVLPIFSRWFQPIVRQHLRSIEAITQSSFFLGEIEKIEACLNVMTVLTDEIIIAAERTIEKINGQLDIIIEKKQIKIMEVGL